MSSPIPSQTNTHTLPHRKNIFYRCVFFYHFQHKHTHNQPSLRITIKVCGDIYKRIQKVVWMEYMNETASEASNVRSLWVVGTVEEFKTWKMNKIFRKTRRNNNNKAESNNICDFDHKYRLHSNITYRKRLVDTLVGKCFNVNC